MACQTIIVLALVCVKYAVTLNCDFDNECDWEANDFGIGSYMEVLKREDTDIANRLMRSRLVDNQGDFAYAHAPVGVLSTVTSGWGSEDTGNVCVIFEAFVTGTESTTEDVHVNVNVNTEIKGNRNISQTVELNGNGRWHEVKISLGKLKENFRVQLAFGALEKSAWIAVDNITLSYDCEEDDNGCTGTDVFACDNSTCISWDHVCNLQSDCDNGKDEDPVLCENVFAGAMTESVCTFEDGLCGWTNVKDKRDSGLDWTRHSGPSPTENTGPNIDHTLGTDAGHYIYIESNDGRIFDYAIVESMVFPEIQEQLKYKNGQTTGICKVRFFYHMYGRVLGRIELWVDDLCGSRRKQIMLWEKEGLKSDQKWHYAEVPITNTSSRYTLQFKGTRSDLPHGDIALDDISLSPECFGIQHDKEKFLIDTATVDIVSLDEFHDQRAAYCAFQNDATDISSVTEKPSNVMQSLTESSSHAQGHTPDIQSVMVEPQKLNVGYVIFIIAAASIFTLVLGAIILCLALRRRNKRQHQAAHLEMITNSSEQIFTNGPVQSTIDMQLRCAATELNPNYDFINAIYPETQLREIPRNKMTLIHMLGQGAFGEVYEGRLRNLCANVRELPVAVKTLPALSTEQAEKDFVMEAIIISKFMHKNVVKCLGVCFKEPPKYIVLELLQGGDLRTFLRESRPTRDQDCILVMGDLVKLALDVANGCHHLEEKHFVHRDIAARNCLLTSRGPDRVAKIADFGMSRDIYSSDYYRKGGKAMLPIKWMPPEAFLDGVFTTKTDVWSFGILLWEIVTLGHMPYPGQTNSDVMHSVASGGRLDPPENCPARLNKIMLMCWNSVPEIRPSFCEIIEHLDMCLQDPEVMETNLSECHLPIGDIFKDASTLTKHSESETMATGGTSDSLSPENSAQYGKFLESQSQEPLLPPKETEEDFNP